MRGVVWSGVVWGKGAYKTKIQSQLHLDMQTKSLLWLHPALKKLLKNTVA